ncbi:hypothetical protein GOP47_0013036 [Adiantum capillus-veneris]|uniref:Uncharacterized protein n=1 Tax=Adiantum capillus-veneris TaxID=13818 RepID=A0A9D4URU5_ADICA|nr:hypothetical protein GOP47_0013036 [Adiantum capillus-veneris]
MDRLVKPNQSSEHKNLHIEAIEDIIDVEHEMGFGEGEDWGHEDVTGYGKLATQKIGPQKLNAYNRARNNSPSRLHAKENGTKRSLQQRPAHVVKLASSSSSSLNDERTPHAEGVVYHGKNLAEFSYKGNPENIITDRMRSMGEGIEDTQRPSRHYSQSYATEAYLDGHRRDQSPREVRKEQDNDYANCSSLDERDNGQRNQSLQTNVGSSNVISRGRVSDSRINTGNKHTLTRQRLDQGNSQKIESDHCLENQQDRMRNPGRVRFSLDFETAEKLMGDKGVKKDLVVHEEEKKQEDRKVGPVDHPVEKGSAVRTRTVSLQRRKEPLTRDARKYMNFDLERVIEMKEDKKAIRLAQDRIERLEEALLRQQEIVANMRVALVQEGLKEYGKLRQLLDALEKNIRKLAISRSRHFAESYQLRHRADQVERLKGHCNMLETDRERLKKKLEQLLESTKEKEKELAALRAEHDRLLQHKAKGSEEFVKEWESKLKKVEASFTEEKAIWEEKLNSCQSDWKDKKQDWAMKLKEKEAELCALKTSQEKLTELLMLCRQGVDELNDVVRLPREDTKVQKLSRVVDGSSEEVDALELARSIYSDTESLKMLLRESPLLLQDEHIAKHTSPLESLEEKSRVLDGKLSNTLRLTDRLKHDMERKEEEIRQENASFEHKVAEKVRQVDALEKQLAEKEHSVDSLVKELKSEVSLLSKELHDERRERSQLSDMQEEVQQKLIKGLEKRESEWEEEIVGLKGKLEDLSAVVALKDGRIDYLEEEVKAKADQLAHEKQKWDSAIKEVKQRAAKAILRFVNDKENGLLEQLLERRKACKTSDGGHQTNTTVKAEEESEATSMNKVTSSLRDQIHGTPSRKQERPAGMLSPRELQHFSKQSETEEPEVHNVKRKHYCPLQNKIDKFAAQSDCMEEELSPKLFEWTGRNRVMEKQDVLDILERQKGNGNTTFALLQSTIQDLE